jgi:Glycosyltransferase GT-D fold
MKQVHDEFETMLRVRDGASLARFGDGEMKMSEGNGYCREPGGPALAAELTAVLTNPAKGCLVGIPTLNPEGPKYESWIRHEARFSRLVNPRMQYYSAFVSRPDSAPWIMTRRYADLCVSVWAGRQVVLLSEKANSLHHLIKSTVGAGEFLHISCPRERAYSVIDEFQNRIIRIKPDIAVLSCGPTATCLANRLTECGIQALDFGSAGGFLRKLLA